MTYDVVITGAGPSACFSPPSCSSRTFRSWYWNRLMIRSSSSISGHRGKLFRSLTHGKNKNPRSEPARASVLADQDEDGDLSVSFQGGVRMWRFSCPHFERLSSTSSGDPSFSVPEHGIEDGQQLSHARRKRQLGGVACSP